MNCRARLSVGTAVTLRFQCTNGMLLETTGVVVRFARVHHALSQFSVAGLAVRFDAELPHPSHL